MEFGFPRSCVFKFAETSDVASLDKVPRKHSNVLKREYSKPSLNKNPEERDFGGAAALHGNAKGDDGGWSLAWRSLERKLAPFFRQDCYKSFNGRSLFKLEKVLSSSAIHVLGFIAIQSLFWNLSQRVLLWRMFKNSLSVWYPSPEGKMIHQKN